MQILDFLRFYQQAQTKYQIHSPFVFEFTMSVLEDRRDYYAFRDVETLRGKLLKDRKPIPYIDFGAGAAQPGAQKQTSARELIQRAACSAAKGRRLFRLVNWLKPNNILELGTSLGISTLYLASAARNASFVGIEGSPACAEIAQNNARALGLKKVQIRSGSFEQELVPALKQLESIDFVYFDGNHRLEPTLAYFKTCLDFAHEKTAFVFDDIYWSEEMKAAWTQIKQDPRVTLSVDLFETGVVFINPEFVTTQHFRVVPWSWKPWMLY